MVTKYPEREHRGHLTDGLWHDDCWWCLRRRRLGGTGMQPEPVVGRQP